MNAAIARVAHGLRSIEQPRSICDRPLSRSAGQLSGIGVAIEPLLAHQVSGLHDHAARRAGFPNDGSVHRAFQRWVRRGLFERL
jgi:hypothetical protein